MNKTALSPRKIRLVPKADHSPSSSVQVSVCVEPQLHSHTCFNGKRRNNCKFTGYHVLFIRSTKTWLSGCVARRGPIRICGTTKPCHVNVLKITLVNKGFGPWRKMSVSDVIWTLNSNMFPEFLYHPHLSRCIRLCDCTGLHTRVTGGL
jgi:hypothetical protein